MNQTLFFAVVLASISTVSLSCSCIPTTFEEQYCQAELSARGKVVATFDNCPGTCDSAEDQDGSIFYFVQVIEKFQGPLIEDNILFLSTAVHSGFCGIVLNVGKEYLFNLHAESPSTDGICPSVTRGVGSCNLPKRWNQLTQEEKDFVESDAMGGTGC